VQPPRLLDLFRQALLARGDSTPTADLLTGWMRAYILFHEKKPPATLGMGHETPQFQIQPRFRRITWELVPATV
jgi:hypothetical protein